jgi:hypothetical protein
MKICALTVVVLLVLSPALAQTAAPTQASPDFLKDIHIDTRNPITPGAAVPVKDEPHHALVLKNDYVHVYNVTVPPLDATLLHQHDLPYIYLTLGATDVVNAVQGKPEVELTLPDGETRYTPGGFAHIARTDAGIPFHNITIELAKPQASPHNLPAGSPERPLGTCPPAGADLKRNPQIPAEQVVPCFETDEVRLDVVRVEGGKDYEEAAPKTAALLVAMSNANLDVSLGGQHAAFLHAGDVLWLPANTARRVEDFIWIRSNFLLLSFKDTASDNAAGATGSAK